MTGMEQLEPLQGLSAAIDCKSLCTIGRSSTSHKLEYILWGSFTQCLSTVNVLQFFPSRVTM